MACVHLKSANLHPPSPDQSVYREDCTLCFDSRDSSAGLDRNEPPFKMSKLAIAPVVEEDRYDTTTKLVCYECQLDDVGDWPPNVKDVVEKLMQAPTFSRKEEVKAWEQEFTPCEHTLCLQQLSNEGLKPTDLSQCSGCDLKENLWLCLECGSLGCGRAQFGGIGGNSHALEHATNSKHGVAVKLRSITPEGSADIYCYHCNEERIDPELAKHLGHWGINIAEQEKTEKSLTEMQIEHNLNWDFSMTSDDGRVLRPVFGPGLTGLKNLGNSCYLASVLQCLFSLKEFEGRYLRPQDEPAQSALPAEDLETQLRKVAHGLLSGRYSIPDPTASNIDTSDTVHQHGLSPSMFKHLIGRGHPEFSTMRQQDAFELLLHLFKLISVSQHPGDLANPIDSFRFALEQRLQCISCKKVRYKIDEQDNISVPVPARRIKSADNTSTDKDQFERVALGECLDTFTGEEIVELSCPGCGSSTGFKKQSLFKTLPQNLIVNARRFELINWVPTKLNIPVEVDKEVMDMTSYLSPETRESEQLLEDDVEKKAAFEPNPTAFQDMLSMGFPEIRIKKALYNTGNEDPEAALSWLFSHMEDPDIDEPASFDNAASPECPPDGEAKVAQLGDMGIPRPKALKALGSTEWDVMRAVDWVFSHPDDDGEAEGTNTTTSSSPVQIPGSAARPAKFQLQSIICHKGTSMHTGHYVAFIRKELPNESEPRWVLFNDEKVVEGGDIEEMKQFAYLYIFRRV
ncbi:hypothetical protein FQN57_002115 [Myotisia sp. PD_48]|nr:hypothetical protein FQN57_002115 [Myotisia sp. PD_48]